METKCTDFKRNYTEMGHCAAGEKSTIDRNHLEKYVKNRFSMELYSFLRRKVEEESLYDYEIAALLRVKSIFVGELRKTFGLRRINGFFRQFEARYGQGAVGRFKSMIEENNISLSDVARHFGFSREYARQSYFRIYGKPYTDVYKKKVTERKRLRDNARTRFIQSAPSMEDTEEGNHTEVCQ